MKWLDRLPLPPLILAALFLGLAPFQPQPHLWEKLQMLFAGTLSRPVDIFDLFLHGILPVLVIIKLVRLALAVKKTTPAQ
jgi:hypothetical protein